MHQEWKEYSNDIGTINILPEMDKIHYELIDYIKDKNPVSGFLIMLSDEEFQRVRYTFNHNDDKSIEFCSLFCIIVYLEGDVCLGKQFSFSKLNETIQSMHAAVACEQLRRIGDIVVDTMDADNDKWVWKKNQK